MKKLLLVFICCFAAVSCSNSKTHISTGMERLGAGGYHMGDNHYRFEVYGTNNEKAPSTFGDFYGYFSGIIIYNPHGRPLDLSAVTSLIDDIQFHDAKWQSARVKVVIVH